MERRGLPSGVNETMWSNRGGVSTAQIHCRGGSLYDQGDKSSGVANKRLFSHLRSMLSTRESGDSSEEKEFMGKVKQTQHKGGLRNWGSSIQGHQIRNCSSHPPMSTIWGRGEVTELTPDPIEKAND